MQTEAVNIIKEEIKKRGIDVKKIILFGSRARNAYKKDSDWDFFVIVDKELDFLKKREIILNVRRRLAELEIPNDIIIQSESIVEQRKNNTGYITYYALKEGIEL
ncbi:MAG: nucleotidyltransferase domain-containing protein [Bacteroidetes bacterium]|nr:nucleotidyltransferase domain-containing protein [Bacteroidota bacterium]